MTVAKPKRLTHEEQEVKLLKWLEAQIDDALTWQLELYPNRNSWSIFIADDERYPVYPSHLKKLLPKYADLNWETEWARVDPDDDVFKRGYNITFE